MSSDLYQRAKTVFAELADLDRDEQQVRLERLSAESPDLVKEVRSLLDYHTAQSLIAPPSTPKIRTRSTLSTTRQSNAIDWLTGPFRCLLIAVPLFGIGMILAWWIHGRVEENLCEVVEARLSEATESAQRELLDWEKRQMEMVQLWCRHPDLVASISKLVAETKNLEASELRARLDHVDGCQELQGVLHSLAGRPVKFAIWDRQMRTLADWNQREQPELLGAYATDAGANVLSRVLRGRSRLFLPMQGVAITEGYKQSGNSPIISIFAPVYDESGSSVVACIMLRGFGLEEEYTSMLKRWGSIENGESYLVTTDGVMVTPSRYEVDSLELATKPSRDGIRIWLRDPGVDLLRGKQPSASPLAWPDTLLARQVKMRRDGSYVSGYPNYVGHSVVGAWRMLPGHDLALAIEQDYETAFSLSILVRRGLYGLTALFTAGLLLFSIAQAITRSPLGRFRDLSAVGPYQVQEILGEGGMGKVYLAEHALLCRQSAIKVLTKGDKDLSVVGRFEREVQLASQLTHPNTIAIFDFGRNKDGVFYYAMEYINGAHLGQLVEYSGPLEPGRCIFILTQLCRALKEAHNAGVVHRDVKPQNIMVCNRGGEPDFVKLFDYGLVKAFAPGVSHTTSQTKVVVGTPRFMAPERLDSPWLADPRVDVYSVGALAYFLLTAQLPPLVSPSETMEAEQPGVETLDLPPDVVEFGGLLSVCMSVEPAARPSSMNSLLRELDELSEKFPWSREESDAWWIAHEAKLLHLVRTKRKKLGNKTSTQF